MKPKKFQVGQEVTPIDNLPWRDAVENDHRPDSPIEPTFGRVYVVTNYNQFLNGDWYIDLKGIPLCSYIEDRFAPVITTKELHSQLEEILNPQHA